MWIKKKNISQLKLFCLFCKETVTISKVGVSVWFVCLISETNSYGQQNN